MKRSPLQRKTELKRSEWLSRNAALNRAAQADDPEKRTKPRKRAARPRKQQVKVPSTWAAAVFAMHGRVCVVTGRPATECHHVITAQTLRRELAAILTRDQLARVLGDPRNGLPVSDPPHDGHHAITVRDERIRRDQLHPYVHEFVADLDREYGTRLAAWLDRFYPPDQEKT